MKEYEIVVTYLNGCAGEAYPQREFIEAELNDPADFVRQHHGKEFEKFIREDLPDGRVIFTYDHTVRYIYEFTEI